MDAGWRNALNPGHLFPTLIGFGKWYLTVVLLLLLQLSSPPVQAGLCRSGQLSLWHHHHQRPVLCKDGQIWRAKLDSKILAAGLMSAPRGGHLAPGPGMSFASWKVLLLQALKQYIGFILSPSDLVHGLAGLQRPQGSTTKIILSSHDYQGTSEDAALTAKIREMFTAGADIAKVATTAEDITDALRILRLPGRSKGADTVSWAV